MTLLRDKEWGGERPLYRREHLRLEGCTIRAGESALKECRDIEAVGCRFEGKYPLWETDGIRLSRCCFAEGSRAAIWYSRHLQMDHCQVDAPKMFREMQGVSVGDTRFSCAQETLWMCRDITLRHVTMEQADYLFMHSSHIRLSDYTHHGNYAFQYCKDVEIHHAVIHSKDAFWNTEDVTICDSVIKGEYFGWYAKNLRLIRCHIAETQPLCYVDGLCMEDCTMAPDADLAFEYSTVQASLHGSVTSIKNPTSGHISVERLGQLIIDNHQKPPADCQIETLNP